MTGHILIVDDEENVAFFLRESLIIAEPDYIVEVVGSGEAALSRMKEQSFNLIITDLKMPGMDGLALVEWVRLHHPETQFIMMTGYHSLERQAEAYHSGVCHYITKPFQVEALMAMVHTILEKSEKSSDGLAAKASRDHKKRVLILSDNEGLAQSIGLSLNYSLHVETASLLSHSPRNGMPSKGKALATQAKSALSAASSSEHSRDGVDPSHCDLIVVAMSSPLNAPIVALARASLLRRVGQIPVLIISERPFLTDPEVQITHLSFPFNTDKLKESVSRILHDPRHGRLNL